jgi:predicted exporter
MLTTHGRRSVAIALFGLAIITGVLIVGTRDLRRVGRIILPVLTAMTATAALLVLFGTRISFLHVVSLLLVLGTGVNYALFFTSNEADAVERRRTARAILVATFTTLCGFGVLIFAATPVLYTIGVTVVLGAALSFVFSAAWASRPAAPTVG